MTGQRELVSVGDGSVEVAAAGVDGAGSLDEGGDEGLGLQHAAGVAHGDVVDGGAGDGAGQADLAVRGG